MKFFICENCKNIVEMIDSPKDIPLVCCAAKMKELLPNTVDASTEKHVPVVEADGCKVKVTVGSALHPMTEEHSIKWIALETDKGSLKKILNPGEEPVAEFCTNGDKPIAVYSYCNLHGLWKTEL